MAVDSRRLLRFSSAIPHGVTLLITLFITAVYSYFVNQLRAHHDKNDYGCKVILGINVAGVAWSVGALASSRHFGRDAVSRSLGGIVLDVAFALAEVVVSFHTRQDRDSCHDTVFEDVGPDGDFDYFYHPHYLTKACNLQKAVLGVAIFSAYEASPFLFFLANFVLENTRQSRLES